jgi:hypothetical protein
VGYCGWTAANNRVFVSGALWVPWSGAQWHDLKTAPKSICPRKDRLIALRSLFALSFRTFGAKWLSLNSGGPAILVAGSERYVRLGVSGVRRHPKILRSA